MHEPIRKLTSSRLVGELMLIRICRLQKKGLMRNANEKCHKLVFVPPLDFLFICLTVRIFVEESPDFFFVIECLSLDLPNSSKLYFNINIYL